MQTSHAILFVDNNELNRLVVVRELADSDVLVAQARSVEEAMTRIRGTKYAAIIVSMSMPKALELIGHIRESDPPAMRRLFVLTSSGDNPFSQVSGDLQFTPFDLSELADQIRAIDDPDRPGKD